MNQQAALAFRCMDLTSLGNQDTPEMIEALCAKARYHEHQVAAICVFPEHVTTAKRALNAQVGPTVPVATVTNFLKGVLTLYERLKKPNERLLQALMRLMLYCRITRCWRVIKKCANSLLVA